jgi:hypothetical protein
MISLAITALLLTAAAAAFSASADGIQANDEFFRATQAARISLRHVLSEVRAGAVNETWTSTNLRVLGPNKSDGSPGPDHTFKYDAAAKKLKLVTNDITTDPDYTLASNISAFAFAVDLGSDSLGQPCVARVSVDITVTVGGNQVRLSGSASPRRNLQYK